MIEIALPNRIIFSSLLIPVVLCGFGAQTPIILYGPEADLVAPDSTVSHFPFDIAVTDTASFHGKTIMPFFYLQENSIVRSHGSRAFILLSEKQLIELEPFTFLEVGENSLTILEGGATFFFKTQPIGFFKFSVTDSAFIQNLGLDLLKINTTDSVFILKNGEKILHGSITKRLSKTSLKKKIKDAEYIYSLWEKEKIPMPGYKYYFPSAKPPIFKQRSRGYGGMATYRENRYYYGGVVWTLYLCKLKFAYDFWLAFDKHGVFYDEAWNDMRDLIDHIHQIELFAPGDPFSIRAGMIENLTLGRGLLVGNYENSVILPFEKRNGIVVRANLKNFRGTFFINDIGYPRVFGGGFSLVTSKKMTIGLGFACDVDQFSNILDSDGDQYPDIADPEPSILNQPTDSSILVNNPPRLDKAGSKSLFGVFGNVDYRFLGEKGFRGSIGGEIGALNSIATGMSFPNFIFGYKWISLGTGFELQSPEFLSGIFDRSYESEKGYLIQKPDGSFEIVSRFKNLKSTEGWLYGWNNSFDLSFDKIGVLRTGFRDVYRDTTRNKNFYLSVNINYRLSNYITKGSFFIEQKNVSHLFTKRTDGESWGIELGIKPHKTMRVNLRYRERYLDKNGDDKIDSRETDRNISASATIDGNYWWKKFLLWVKK